MSIKFSFLPAGSGDCILVQSDDFTMLIDSGDAEEAFNIREKLEEALKDQKIDLVILTHIDDDHIGGIKILLNDPIFLTMLHSKSQIWMNYPNGQEVVFESFNENSYISYKGGDLLKKLANEKRIILKDYISIENTPPLISLGEFIKIELLSPNLKKLNTLYKKWNPSLFQGNINDHINQTDYRHSLKALGNMKESLCTSVPNGSSLAFILHYKNYKFLFLADAHTGIIRKSLQNLGYSSISPIEVDFVKVSHHGSKYNISKKLLDLIKSNSFVFLTNSEYFLPHKQTLERILNRRHYFNNVNLNRLIFNYEEPIAKIQQDLCIKCYNTELIHQQTISYGD
ncbi:MBL fold metallo-hydrolase [uncultured Thiothrix sp.]|uniref:ComEC/Rec2 family competence protein n=1 Tax=uncultured Thiothrix sp. TaxID=223185 RepID=UPI00262D510B|nr:MBL fold metallo-hydrolase [uncultured Thiothrix sp.]